MESVRLKEIATYFLKLGFTGFGGPLALVAQMEKDLTGKGWISKTEFAQVFAAIKTMPGPLAFQTAVFMGQRRGKTLGAATAAVLLIAPSAMAMVLIASTRSSWSALMWTKDLSLGFQAAALGLIGASAFQLAQSAGKGATFWLFASLGFMCTAIRPSLESVVVIGCGLLSIAPRFRKVSSHPIASALALGPKFLAALGNSAGAATGAALPVSAALVGVSAAALTGALAWTCFKAGALVFGSGLAIVPILGSEFVDRLHWLTQSEFLEALMFGQITPGPIVITATYVGYRVLGLTGALVATVAIFAAPFFHMTTWFPRMWARISKSLWWTDFSRGAISCVVGSIAASVVKLAEPVWLSILDAEQSGKDLRQASPTAWVTILIWLLLPTLSFWLTVKRKTPSWILVLGGGAISLAVFQLANHLIK